MYDMTEKSPALRQDSTLFARPETAEDVLIQKSTGESLISEVLQQSLPSKNGATGETLLAQAGGYEPPAPGRDNQPARPKPGSGSLLDTIVGGEKPSYSQEQAAKPETININGQPVKIASAIRDFDGSRVIVTAEDFGVNPAGTKITYYDQPSFPQGRGSRYGSVHAIAEHPSGSKVYTKLDGNVVYDLKAPLKTDYPGGPFESKFFEELPNGTQLWRTTSGVNIERHAKDSLTSSKGSVDRIEMVNGKLNYLTQDGKTFSLEEQGGKIVISDIENGRVTSTSRVDSFTEKFDPPFNHPFYGPALSRTRAPGEIRLDLGTRGECTIYTNPVKFDDTRNTLSVIKDAKTGSAQYYLSDGTTLHMRPAGAPLQPHDWVKVESKATREQTITYNNGDFITKRPNGERIEGYKDGHATSLPDKVVEVQRLKDKNVYVLADGGKVELPLRGGSPLIKTGADGRPQMLKEGSVKESFPHGQQSAYGLVSTLETSNTGETTYWLANNQDNAKITLLSGERNGFKGYVTKADGSARMISALGEVLDRTQMSEQAAADVLNGRRKMVAPPPAALDDLLPLFSR